MGRLVSLMFASSMKRSVKSISRISATFAMSFSKSGAYESPLMTASEIALEISDLPPPETVAGLWQVVDLEDEPISVHCDWSFSSWAKWI